MFLIVKYLSSQILDSSATALTVYPDVETLKNQLLSVPAVTVEEGLRRVPDAPNSLLGIC